MVLAASFAIFTHGSVAHASCTNIWDEWQMWDRSECKATMILQPASRGVLHSRALLDADLGFLQSRGWTGDRNFVWYSNETGLRAGFYLTGQEWSYWSGGTQWININSVFQENTWLSVYEYDGTFISRVCGNFTQSTVNPPHPVISGSKWNDLNENGIWDAGEPKLANWPITLEGHENSATNSNGDYSFNMDANWGRLPGCYVVTEGSESGWRSTTATSRSVCIPEGAGGRGTNFSGNNFGNFKYGSISGTKWVDINGDDVIDAGDTRGAGWTMVLKKSGVLVATTDTDVNGNYTFSNLNYGDYTVEELLPDSSWFRKLPAGGQHSCSVISGTVCSGKDFLNEQYGIITAYKWHDLNNDQSNNDMQPIEGWGFTLTGTALNGDAVERTGSTGADGMVTFDNVVPGNYSLTEESREWWAPTTEPTRTISLAGGQKVDEQFGNILLGNIEGYKYEDYNGNHVLDEGEAPVEGTQICVQEASGLTAPACTVTDSDGRYEFLGLVPGEYTLTETPATDWVATAGTTRHINVVGGQWNTTDPFMNVEITSYDGRMTGGGYMTSLFMPLKVTFGYELHCDASSTPNNLEINWGKSNMFHLENLDTVACTDNPTVSPEPPNAGFDTYIGSGTGRLNGVSGATAEWTFLDSGEPGRNDIARIIIRDANGNVVLNVVSVAKGGNLQAHK